MSGLFDLVEAAWSKRRPLVAGLDMFRLFDGAADGMPNLYIDRIGPFCLAHILADDLQAARVQETLKAAAERLVELVSSKTLYVRTHAKDPKNSAASAVLRLHGESIPETIVTEHGIRYMVRPEVNVNAGIFLDTRDLRSMLKSDAKGLKVLNTFCFTGSLGIAAFAGSAREVVQVDSSKSVLGWARENFELNKTLGQGAMRFICDDCLTFMQREARRIKEGAAAYELIILDPPSFGKAGKKVFSLRKDLPELIESACGILAPHSKLSISSNTRSLSDEDLDDICGEAVRRSGFSIAQQIRLRAPAQDFTAEGSDSIATRGIFMRLKMDCN